MADADPDVRSPCDPVSRIPTKLLLLFFTCTCTILEFWHW